MDEIIRAVTGDGAIRCFAAVTTDMADEARKIHNTSPLATAALGRLITAAAMMGSMMKGENDSLTIQVDGGGPLGKLVAVSDSSARVKGYVTNPDVWLPLKNGKLDVGGGVGKDGLLGIIRDFGLKEPYVGKVSLATGEIGDDIALYYARSEQIPAVVALGVLVDKDLSVKAAGGIIIQVMPEATEEQVKKLEDMVSAMKPVTQMLEDGFLAEDMAAVALDGFMSYTMESQNTRYECDCSKERIERAVYSLGKTEIEDIIEKQGNAEISCYFCNKSYIINEDELKKMLNK